MHQNLASCSIISPAAVQNPFANIALATNMPLLCLASAFAAEFTRPISVANAIEEDVLSSSPWRTRFGIDEELGL